MKSNEPEIDPNTWENIIRVAIAVLSALLGFFSANAANALFIS